LFFKFYFRGGTSSYANSGVKVLCIFFAAFLDGKQGVNDYSVVNIFNPPGRWRAARGTGKTRKLVRLCKCTFAKIWSRYILIFRASYRFPTRPLWNGNVDTFETYSYKKFSSVGKYRRVNTSTANYRTQFQCECLVLRSITSPRYHDCRKFYAFPVIT
jgi:hypothetical protein